MATQIGWQEFYNDQIIAVGSVRRIYFHGLAYMDDGTKQWLYVGTTPAEKPPTTGDPVTTYTYIAFPVDFQYLPPSIADDYLYEMSKMAGVKRAGWANW